MKDERPLASYQNSLLRLHGPWKLKAHCQLLFNTIEKIRKLNWNKLVKVWNSSSEAWKLYSKHCYSSLLNTKSIINKLVHVNAPIQIMAQAHDQRLKVFKTLDDPWQGTAVSD